MITVDNCEVLSEHIGSYIEGALNAEYAAAIEEHLAVCANCREGVERYRAVKGLAEYVQLTPTTGSPEAVSDAAPEAPETTAPKPGIFASWLSEAPWWAVSCMLHVLVIALAGLVSMAITLPQSDDTVIMVTELQQRAEIQQEEKKKDDAASALLPHEVPATDPKSTEVCPVVVTPEILAQAQLSDHFETINPDMPDTHTALGDPDARIFHTVSGSTDNAGGGGTGGLGMDDVVGVGGAATKGKGGGFGGGDGTGEGMGSGAGKAGFGQRMGGGRRLLVKKFKGNQATETAVDKGLEWLARNQEVDGRWSCTNHGGKHGGRMGDAAMTGYALLAFLGAGNTERVGKYKDVVKNGVLWLIDNQKKETKVDGRWVDLNYTNGIATMALGEAAGMGRIKETREAAQNAINAVADAQRQTEGTSDREAWDYGPRGGANDSSVMAWNILALKSCKVASLHVDHACFEGVLNWIDAGQDLGNLKPTDAAPSYDWEGGLMAYRGTCKVPNKGQGGMAVTAAAALCRLMIGGANGDDPGVLGPCNMIKNKYIPKAYPYNMYFGYYATLLMFQKGGEYWTAWNDSMKKILPEAQIKGGADDGSWNPDDNTANCRVMSTALCVLCMEVYYRYIQLNAAK